MYMVDWACQHLLGVKNFSFETELFPYMFYGIIADRCTGGILLVGRKLV